MKIIIEANIPFIKGLLEPFGAVTYLSAADITAEAVRDADCLFVRTRTRCDARLLEHSRVRFIATATIGTDHIDLPYCREHGIAVYNAPGCNAPAVAQYVYAVIAKWMMEHADADMSLTIGIVGVGHVGSIVARWGERLGFRVLKCDPPRFRREGGDFVALNRIAAEADIITFHTPLTREGDDPTFHLADSRFLASLRRCRLLINSSRGGVVDNAALVDCLSRDSCMDAAIDCWEHEPDIDPRLLKKVFVATPHIAGYSKEGKARATAMALHAFARHFGVDVEGIPEVDAPAKGADVNSLEQIAGTYNPLDDTKALRGEASAPAWAAPFISLSHAKRFEQLRNHYALRSEVQ